MKTIIICCALWCAGGLNAKAQTIGVMTEQLAALRALQHTTQQGYQLVTNSLKSIGAITGEELLQHSHYFNRLLTVNPQLANEIQSTSQTLFMTKQMLLGLISLFSTAGTQLHSQTIADLLVQLSLDTQKLSSLKSTLQDMYTGYASIRQGYTRVRDIAKDNFDLHQLFLNGLWTVSPNVRSDPHITTLLHTEDHVVADYQTAAVKLSGPGPFTTEERNYILGTYSGLLRLTQESIEELTMVITDNQLRMSDAQRLQGINRLDSEAKTRLAFLQQLNKNILIQSAQRQAAANDINTLKSLYGISH